MRTRVALSVLCIYLVTPPAEAQTTWHVDDDNCPGPGSGGEADPFCKIQDGIDAAVDGDECVVAPGTYNETINFNGKAISLRSSGGSDVTTVDANDSGSVVSCTSGEGLDTVLQGFTITGGDAISGGGMRNVDSSPTIINCKFVANEAAVGAGMYNEHSNPTMTRCTFMGNSTGTNGSGGGMLNMFSSNPLLIDCIFRQNTADSSGGGLQSINSHVTAINCKFVENAAERGGGMRAYNGNLMLINCRFEGNVASIAGGGVQNQSNNLVIVNTIFAGNMADRGGGMYDGSDNSTTVTNCTFIGNSANDNYGGGIGNSSVGTTVTNCILWNNDGGSISGIMPTVTYSDIEGGFPGTGNIGAEPLFADPDNGDYRLSPGSPCIDAADNTAVPADTSDLDDDGDTQEPIPLDLDGNPRFVDDPDTDDTGNPDGINPIVDMGAYEFGPPDCVHDDGDGLVTICHIPPGNSNNAHTITVNANAVPAHLAHGDTCGPCEGDGAVLPMADDGEACLADMNGDGFVDAFDLATLLAFWGLCPKACEPGDPLTTCTADLDGNAEVGPFDLALLLGNWGPCPL